MDNIITLNSSKENSFDFDLSIKGIDDTNPDVRFVIEAAELSFSFKCKRDGDKWTVFIPHTSHLVNTMYPFAIEVIADGYFFKPMSGQINVMASAELYATKPKNKDLPPNKDVEKVSVSKKPKVDGKIKEDSASHEKIITTVTSENNTVNFDIDETVRSLLADEATNKKKQPKLTFKKGGVFLK